MKSIEKVLLAICNECSRQTKLAEISCFDKIARLAGVSSQNLPVFLSDLQERGYIQYSVAGRFIYLTQAGKQFSAHTFSQTDTMPARRTEAFVAAR